MSDDEISSNSNDTIDNSYTSYISCDIPAGPVTGNDERLKKMEDDERRNRAAAFHKHRIADLTAMRMQRGQLRREGN